MQGCGKERLPAAILWIFLPGKHIIWNMRKASALIASFILLLSPLAAEMASWYTAMEPSYFTESGTLFDDRQRGAASATLPMGTVVELSNPVTGTSVVTTVIDTLPELPAGRTIALTEATAEELRMLDTGLGDIKVSVIREGTITRQNDNDTGWYSFQLGTYTDMDDLMLKYGRLRANGLRPYISIADDGVHLAVRHVQAYQIDDAVDRITLSGIVAPEAVSEPNPYL